MLTEEILFNSLKKQPYVQVEFPLPKRQMEEAIESFFKFLELPDHLKNHIDFKLRPIQRRGDIGFKHRDPEDGPYSDSKDFFHFHPLIFEKYGEFLKENPVVNDFLMKANLIWESAYQTIQGIMKLIDTRFPGTSNKVFDTKEVRIFLRFLKYNWSNSGKYLAKPHFDAGSFTLAIGESCPGLRIGKGPEDLKIIEHQENHALFMLSSTFQKVIDTDEFSAGWHDVIQLDETQIGKPFSRWAIVAFIEVPNIENPARSETHKWYNPEVA